MREVCLSTWCLISPYYKGDPTIFYKAIFLQNAIKLWKKSLKGGVSLHTLPYIAWSREFNHIQ